MTASFDSLEKIQMHRLVITLSALFSMAACSTQPRPVAPRPVIKTIAIVPATSPVVYTFENVAATQFLIPLAATFNYLDSKEKAKSFNEKIGPRESSLASDFTQSMADALRSHGYEVQVLENVARPADYADDVDYDKIVTRADAVLHIKFTEVGLFSPRSSLNYIPRVHAYGVLFVPGREDYLYDQEIYYGADARKGNSWAISADEKYTYPSFEAVISNIDGVRKAFDTGAREISKRMSDQIRAALK